MSIEIFIRDIEIVEAIEWISLKLGNLTELDVSDEIHYLRAEPTDIRVVVTPHMEDGPFLSLFINGANLPWQTSGELAALCAQELNRTARWCDESTNGWMEKQGTRPSTPIAWLD